jgi:hypothetical protein
MLPEISFIAAPHIEFTRTRDLALHVIASVYAIPYLWGDLSWIFHSARRTTLLPASLFGGHRLRQSHWHSAIQGIQYGLARISWADLPDFFGPG